MKKFLFISSLLICATAYAQEEAEIRLHDTVISGSGFEGAQRSEIKNITVIHRKDIEDRGYQSVEEILKNAPGVNFSFSGFGAVPDLRGQGSQGTDESGFQGAAKRVKILVDGIPQNLLDVSHAVSSVNVVPVENIKKIEIINGGGSVLYGSGTAGGVIHIITDKKKNDKKAYHGKIYYQNSSYDNHQVGVNTDFQLSEKLSAEWSTDFQKGLSYQDSDKIKNITLQGGLHYKIDKKQSLHLKASKQKQDYFDTEYSTKEELAENRRRKSDWMNTDGEIDRNALSLEHKIDMNENLKFQTTAYFQKTKRDYEQHLKKNIFGTVANLDIDGKMKERKLGFNTKGEYSYSQGKLIFGYDYIQDSLEREANMDIHYSYKMPVFAPGRRPVMQTVMNKHHSPSQVDLEKDTHSLFLLHRHAWTPKWESSLGYRYEYSKYDIEREGSLQNFVNNVPTRQSKNSLNSKKSTSNQAAELGLNYKYSDTGNIYAKYERGFRSPSPTELVNKNLRTGYSINNVKSERYDTYEIGLKDYWWNSFVSATLFHTKTKDEIFTNMITHGFEWKTSNLPETKRQGFELFAEQYFKNFRIHESLSYIQAKISKGEEKGKYVANVPKWKLSLGASYDVNPSLSFYGDLNYYSGARDNGYKAQNPSPGLTHVTVKNIEPQKLSSYLTVDLGAKYRHESGFGLQAGVKNVFNKKYYIYENKATNEYTPANGRSYYLGLSYQF